MRRSSQVLALTFLAAACGKGGGGGGGSGGPAGGEPGPDPSAGQQTVTATATDTATTTATGTNTGTSTGQSTYKDLDMTGVVAVSLAEYDPTKLPDGGSGLAADTALLSRVDANGAVQPFTIALDVGASLAPTAGYMKAKKLVAAGANGVVVDSDGDGLLWLSSSGKIYKIGDFAALAKVQFTSDNRLWILDGDATNGRLSMFDFTSKELKQITDAAQAISAFTATSTGDVYVTGKVIATSAAFTRRIKANLGFEELNTSRPFVSVGSVAFAGTEALSIANDQITYRYVPTNLYNPTAVDASTRLVSGRWYGNFVVALGNGVQFVDMSTANVVRNPAPAAEPSIQTGPIDYANGLSFDGNNVVKATYDETATPKTVRFTLHKALTYPNGRGLRVHALFGTDKGFDTNWMAIAKKPTANEYFLVTIDPATGVVDPSGLKRVLDGSDNPLMTPMVGNDTSLVETALFNVGGAMYLWHAHKFGKLTTIDASSYRFTQITAGSPGLKLSGSEDFRHGIAHTGGSAATNYIMYLDYVGSAFNAYAYGPELSTSGNMLDSSGSAAYWQGCNTGGGTFAGVVAILPPSGTSGGPRLLSKCTTGGSNYEYRIDKLASWPSDGVPIAPTGIGSSIGANAGDFGPMPGLDYVLPAAGDKLVATFAMGTVFHGIDASAAGAALTASNISTEGVFRAATALGTDIESVTAWGTGFALVSGKQAGDYKSYRVALAPLPPRAADAAVTQLDGVQVYAAEMVDGNLLVNGLEIGSNTRVTFLFNGTDGSFIKDDRTSNVKVTTIAPLQ